MHVRTRKIVKCLFVCACRRVVEHGMYMKHCKVEVYLMEFKLSIHPRYDQVTSKPFSKGDSVGKKQ